MSKLNNKSKKGIIIGVVGFITASTIIGLASGVTVSKQNNDKKQSSELLAKKTETITKINQLPELKNEQITKYTNDVNNAKTINQVDQVLTDAIGSNNANKTTKPENTLLDKKQTIKNEVDALVDLNNQQKQIFKNLIDQADSKQKVDSILNDAKKQEQTNKALEELKKAKSQVIEQINALTNLTNEQKTNFKIQINQAKTIDMAQLLLKEANQLNETNKQTQIQKTEELKNKKNQTTNTINQLTDLTPDQKTNYINQINSANSIESIDLILENANKQNEDNKTKQLNNNGSSNGDQNIQSQNHTSQGQNNNKPILNSKSPNDQDLEKQKLDQEKKEVLNRYNDFVKTIEDYIKNELSDQKYNELKTDLEKVIAETQPIASNSSTTKEQLEEAIGKLTTIKKDVENKKLDIVKENAKESIEQLSNLEKAKKDEYKQRVVDANSENDINLILEETKSDDEKSKALKIQAEKEKEEQAELNKKKDDAINKINMFSSLDKTRLETFIKEIQKINDSKQA
ncbi:GA module-containing protein, partial [Ureaplasma diversum]|uniref:GA module-containing protein n=1 Tax=Ureaplasma diversum TaxID=42094 RepID=UPI00056E1095